MDKRADQDLDNLIFSDQKAAAQQAPPAPGAVRRESTDDVDSQKPQQTGPEEEAEASTTARKSLKFDRASLVNVLPVDKLKNGASTASKVFGQTFSTLKEKTSAAYETAKQSNAGTAISGGINRAAAAGSEQMTKLRETDAYKKASSVASTQLEKASVVSSVALEKAKATASVGLEKAKSGAEAIKSKVGSSDKKE